MQPTLRINNVTSAVSTRPFWKLLTMDPLLIAEVVQRGLWDATSLGLAGGPFFLQAFALEDGGFALDVLACKEFEISVFSHKGSAMLLVTGHPQSAEDEECLFGKRRFLLKPTIHTLTIKQHALWQRVPETFVHKPVFTSSSPSAPSPSAPSPSSPSPSTQSLPVPSALALPALLIESANGRLFSAREYVPQGATAREQLQSQSVGLPASNKKECSSDEESIRRMEAARRKVLSVENASVPIDVGAEGFCENGSCAKNARNAKGASATDSCAEGLAEPFSEPTRVAFNDAHEQTPLLQAAVPTAVHKAVPKPTDAESDIYKNVKHKPVASTSPPPPSWLDHCCIS